jgi:hypothetical protein
VRKLSDYISRNVLVTIQKQEKYLKRRLFLDAAVWIRSRILYLMRMDLSCVDVTDPRVQTKKLPNSGQFEFLVMNRAILHVLSGVAFTNVDEIPTTMVAQSSIWDPIYGMNDFGIIPKNPPYFDGDNLNLVAVPLSKNYFHWVIDYLPYIVSAKVVDEKAKFICSEHLTQYQLQALNCLEIEPELILYSDWVVAENVIVPKTRHLSGSPTIQSLELLRESFGSLVSHTEGTNSRLYVSRRYSSRSLHNEAEVERILKENGFEILYLETLSFKSQIEKFANSVLVIAPHGAGLTNILWCKYGTKVIEVTSSRIFNPCYRNLSKQIGLIHEFMSDEKLFEYICANQF